MPCSPQSQRHEAHASGAAPPPPAMDSLVFQSYGSRQVTSGKFRFFYVYLMRSVAFLGQRQTWPCFLRCILQAPQYVRQILTRMKEEINNNTIIVGDFNTPLTTMDRSTKQKISKETETLNDTMDQLDLTDIYRTFLPKTMKFNFFSSAHGTFSRIDHIVGHKSSLGKFKKIEIILSIFSDHNAVRLDLNYRKKNY